LEFQENRYGTWENHVVFCWYTQMYIN
jgi:hypothetical protein